MKRSTDRILTTHTGSLPRPADLVSMEEGHDQRDLLNDQRFEEQVTAAVREIVRKQVDAKVDIVDDGEASKVSYATYVTERLTGFDGEARPMRAQVDAAAFPEFYRERGMNPNT